MVLAWWVLYQASVSKAPAGKPPRKKRKCVENPLELHALEYDEVMSELPEKKIVPPEAPGEEEGKEEKKGGRR